MLAGGAGTLASSLGAQAAAEPANAYAAFFLGQGGYWFSWGIPKLAVQAHELGLEADVFRYSDLKAAWNKLLRRKKDGQKIALVGFSLGNTTATYLQTLLEIDLLLAISESSLARNHRIKKQNTKRSVLWCGPGFLSNAGQMDGFDQVNYVDDCHLCMNMNPLIVEGVLDELKDLI